VQRPRLALRQAEHSIGDRAPYVLAAGRGIGEVLEPHHVDVGDEAAVIALGERLAIDAERHLATGRDLAAHGHELNPAGTVVSGSRLVVPQELVRHGQADVPEGVRRHVHESAGDRLVRYAEVADRDPAVQDLPADDPLGTRRGDHHDRRHGRNDESVHVYVPPRLVREREPSRV
jgi:hypothetical protein